MAERSPYCDLHIHTRFSCDCGASMQSMCDRALSLGLRYVAFTEHVDYVPVDVCSGFFRPAAYMQEVERCRARHDGRLAILAGVEIGEMHRYGDLATELLAEGEYDLVIGSLHWVGGELCFEPSYLACRTRDQAYTDYFSELLTMCEAGGFDVLGHMDILKRHSFRFYGGYEVSQYRDLIQAVLRTLVEQRIALEVNTSPLRRPVGETSPSLEVLCWYREVGGELVTIGSDAHAPANVGAGWGEAVALLRQAGFSHLTVFNRRAPHLIPLEVV